MYIVNVYSTLTGLVIRPPITYCTIDNFSGENISIFWLGWTLPVLSIWKLLGVIENKNASQPQIEDQMKGSDETIRQPDPNNFSLRFITTTKVALDKVL